MDEENPPKKVAKKAQRKSKSKATTKQAATKGRTGRSSGASNYPRQSIEKALRIPQVLLGQNAGKEATDQEAAAFLGINH